MEKCIGCELCAGVCPADCIYVRGADNPPDHPVSPGERYGFVYEINFLRCIHCDLCVEACPTEAITESKLLEFSFTNRTDAIYTKDELLVDDDGKPKHLPWEDWREGDDLHTSGWMRATSPSGARRVRGPGAVVGRARLRRARPRGGPVGHRDDATTGSRQLRDTLERHLVPADLPADKRGPRGAIGRMLEKAERFAPGAGKKHRDRGRRRVRRRRAGRQHRAGRAGERDRRHRRSPPRTGRGLMAVRARSGARRRGRLRPRLWVDVGTFAVAAAIILSGAVGVVVARNPVHSALMLVMTLFGVAVLFVLQRDPLPGRRAGDRLRRRHRGAVPVRHHVPRGRPGGEHRRRAAAAVSGRWPSG